jgi:hypothetical protein
MTAGHSRNIAGTPAHGIRHCPSSGVLAAASRYGWIRPVDARATGKLRQKRRDATANPCWRKAEPGVGHRFIIV